MKIACVSISRSDWNALGMVAKALREQGADVEVYAHEKHEAPEMIGADGFALSARSKGDTLADIDTTVYCGDRFQTLRAASWAARFGVPIAHLAGGDITEGSTDDSYRHAITKLAHLHFPTHKEAADRIRQMGEEPWRVFEHGSASVDRIKAEPLYSRPGTLAEFRIPDEGPLFVLNWQSTGQNHHASLHAIIAALAEFPDANVVAVGSNDDPGGDEVNTILSDLAARNGRVRFVRHATTRGYLSLLHHCTLLVGNSSSCYYEAPILGCVAVDVGKRQQGRPRPESVLHARGDASNVADRMRILMAEPKRATYPTPFGDGNAAPRIAETIIAMSSQRDALLRKKFVALAA